MNETLFYKSSPSVFVICVDHINCSGLSGRVYHCNSAEAVRFAEAGNILIEMDKIFDRIGFPQSSTQSRSFGVRKSPAGPDREGASGYMQEDEVTRHRGEKGTFVVHVQSRQNATWQGKVLWAEKNSSQNFRSALELLKLIDSALDEAGEDQE